MTCRCLSCRNLIWPWAMSHRLNLLFKPDPPFSTARAGGNVRRNAGSSGSWCVSPSPFSNSPILSGARVGEEPWVLHNTCAGCGSQSLWAHRVSLRAAQHRGGENMFKKIFLIFFFNKSVLVSGDLRVFLDSREGNILPLSQVSNTTVTTWISTRCCSLFLCLPSCWACPDKQPSICWQTWLQKGFPPHLHLSPGFCSPWGSPVSIAGWCYNFLVMFLLFFFLSSISISPLLDLQNSGRGKRFKHWENLPKIDREENQNKPWFWTVTKIHKRRQVPIYTSQLSDTRWLSDGNWSHYVSTPTHTLLTALLRTSPSLKSQRQVPCRWV